MTLDDIVFYMVNSLDGHCLKCCIEKVVLPPPADSQKDLYSRECVIVVHKHVCVFLFGSVCMCDCVVCLCMCVCVMCVCVFLAAKKKT